MLYKAIPNLSKKYIQKLLPLSNEGARQQFELFLEDLILPQMVQAAQVSVKSVFMFPVCAKYYLWSHRGRNRIVVGFTATCAINSNPVFQLYRGGQFYWWRSTRRKPPTCYKSLTNFIT
jgi:hypothetical protein